MSLLPELSHILSDAMVALYQNSDWDLPPIYRWTIRDFLCTLQVNVQGHETNGHKAWVAIEVASLKHVLPIWEKHNPNDDTPQRLLAEAEQFLQSGLNTMKAEQIAFNFSEDTGASSSDQYVLGGAIAVLVFAIRLTTRSSQCLSRRTDSILTNRTLEYPHDWDASLCASVAYSGDTTLRSMLSKQRRLEFWNWWLSIAVPESCSAYLGSVLQLKSPQSGSVD